MRSGCCFGCSASGLTATVLVRRLTESCSCAEGESLRHIFYRDPLKSIAEARQTPGAACASLVRIGRAASAVLYE